MNVSNPNPQQAGFTLIELLVALAIMGLAAGLLVAGFNAAWLALRPERAGVGDDSVVAAQRILRARLERLAPVIRADSANGVVDAAGDAGMFSFTAAPLDRQGPGVAQRFRLVLSPAGDLMLYTASSLDDRIDLRDPSLVAWQSTRLLGGAAAMDIAYFGPDRQGSADHWQMMWVDRQQAPALVRIRLRLAEGDRRYWPDLIVRPRATVNAACRIRRGGTGRCEVEAI